MVLLLGRRRAVGMGIHDTGAGVRDRDMNWLAFEVGLLSTMAGRHRRMVWGAIRKLVVLSACVVMGMAYVDRWMMSSSRYVYQPVRRGYA
jgi:hypothetical protein